MDLWGPILVEQWQQTPCLRGRIAVEQDVKDGRAVFYLGNAAEIGARFFSDSADPRELAFVSTKATPTGVLINSYRYVGALRTE